MDIESNKSKLDGVTKTDVIIITESYSNESDEHIKKVGK